MLLNLAVDNRLPYGWVQVTGHPPAEVSRLARLLTSGHNAAVVYVGAPDLRAGLRDYSVSCSGPVVFDTIRELVRRGFNAIVVDHFDAIHEANPRTDAHRAYWIGQQVRRLRAVLKTATVIAVCRSARAGGKTFQRHIGLRLNIVPNHKGLVVTAGGRAARVGAPAVVI